MANNMSLKEVEKLGYYDFLSYLGVPFFHLGGLKSSLELAGLCQIEKGKKVLMVGCGAGLSACFLAKRLGCNVVGVDIAQVSISQAKERANQEHLEDKVEFRVADAIDLPFEDNTFDAVITEFASMFIDKTKAFKEFVRVLKPAGYVGIHELFKGQDIPSGIADELLIAEKIFQELSSFNFRLYSRADWSKWLKKAGLTNVQVNKYHNYIRLRELPEYSDQIRIEELPEYTGQIKIKELPRILKVVRNIKDIFSLSFNRRKFKYLILSKTIRERLKKYRTMQTIFFKKETTSRYVGCILGVAQKA